MAASTPQFPFFSDSLLDSSSTLKSEWESFLSSDFKTLLSSDLASSIISNISPSDDYTVSAKKESTQLLSNATDAEARQLLAARLVLLSNTALSTFMQANVTGPPLAFQTEDLLLPESLRGNGAETAKVRREVRSRMVKSLSVDGEAGYELTPSVELFLLASAIISSVAEQESNSEDNNFAISLAWTKLRVQFLHQRLLSEATETLRRTIYQGLKTLQTLLATKEGVALGNEVKVLSLLERAAVHTYFGEDKAARADLESAARETGFEFALTGRLGKRTKFQQRDTSQLVVLAKSVGTEAAEATNTENGDASLKPQNLDLNDDTLLESISFTKDAPSSQAAVDADSSLSPALASLDPANQPKLAPLDSIILLSIASAITNTSPENGLTREETAPYATRVLDGGSSNWQIYSHALLVRSRVEGYSSRTVERGVLQLQALVDQVIAETTSENVTSNDGDSAQPTTFLPRATESESAPVEERLRYVFALAAPTRWSLEAELASKWVHLGGLRTALEIYERLEMWAEAALCHAATENEAKALEIVRGQLYISPDSKEEKAVLPANAPRLFCIMGEIENDPSMFERAWTVSGNRYARAQRSLARHYLQTKPPNFLKAALGYRLSLQINRLNHTTWFALGCVELELEEYSNAVDSFTRSVQLEDGDAEAWSNLAAALMRLPPQEENTKETTTPKLDDEEEDIADEPAASQTKKPRIDALSALRRATALKREDYRIWDNFLTIAASVPPPDTPLHDIITAQARLIELRGSAAGEKCVDASILSNLVRHLITHFDPQDPALGIPKPIASTGEAVNASASLSEGAGVRYTVPARIVQLVDIKVRPLITHNAELWQLVAQLEIWRKRPRAALQAHEKAWRAIVTRPGIYAKTETEWNQVADATAELVEWYESLGQREAEDGDGEELVAKDWKFKSRSAVRGVLGKAREMWEGTKGWEKLEDVMTGLKGSS